MTATRVRTILDAALDRGRLSEADVFALMAAAPGAADRQVAELLAALDRTAIDRPPSWDDVFVSMMLAYIEAAAETAGRLDRDAINWLTTTLDAGGAMTDNALRIAVEATRLTGQADPTLTMFVLQAIQARRSPATHGPRPAGDAGANAALEQNGPATPRPLQRVRQVA